MAYDDIPTMMTPKQLAKLTGQHEGSIRRGIAEGRIPADKVNGRWVICKDNVFPIAMKENEHAKMATA